MSNLDNLPKYMLDFMFGMSLSTIYHNREKYEPSVYDWLEEMSNITPRDIDGTGRKEKSK